MQSLCVKSQCKDLFGKSAECPTPDDSMVIYNNCVKIYQYYETNKDYKKVKSIPINNEQDRKTMFNSMISAREKYRQTIKEHEEYLKKNGIVLNTIFNDLPYESYFTEVDEYRFYQRELEFLILNWDAPFPMYDLRISPIFTNIYKYVGESNNLMGDEVNIAIYVPVTVKPISLLTESELETRNKILRIENKKIIPKQVIVKRSMVKRDSIIPKVIKILPNDTQAIVKNETKNTTPVIKNYTSMFAVYSSSPYGGGAFIGYMIDGKFKKVLREEYIQYAIPPYARKLLEDDKELDNMLKIKFGAYYKGMYF